MNDERWFFSFTVLIVSGASEHIILQNIKPTYESWKKCWDGADTSVESSGCVGCWGRALLDTRLSRDPALWFNPTFISLLSASDIIVLARNLIS